MPDWPVGVDTSAMAENYARYLVPAVLSVWTVDTLQRVQPRPGDTVLDVACGTGVVTFDVAQLVGSTGRVVGVDTDLAMLAIAERIRRAREMNNVSLREITRAAGARNVVAVQHHFADRDGLLHAIIDKHHVRVEERRHVLLDACETGDAFDAMRDGSVIRTVLTP